MLINFEELVSIVCVSFIAQPFPSDTQAEANQFDDFFTRVSRAERQISDNVVKLRDSTCESASRPTLSKFDLRPLLFSLNKYISASFDGIQPDGLRRSFHVLIEIGLLLTNNIITIYSPISILSCIS